jgi:hypothetical protein
MYATPKIATAYEAVTVEDKDGGGVRGPDELTITVATPASGHILAELETYQWQDTYFESHHYHDHEIIAVFDHDRKEVAKPWNASFFVFQFLLLEMAVLVIAFVPMTLFPYGYDTSYYSSSFFWDNFAFIIGAAYVVVVAATSVFHYLKLSQIEFPHTAVTNSGICHVNGEHYWIEGSGQEKYWLPFNGIVDFESPNLQLVNPLNTYETPEPCYARGHNSPTTLSLASLKNPALFQKLLTELKRRSNASVVDLSTLSQQETVFASSMIELVQATAQDGEQASSSTLEAIHMELKRHNDILAAALASTAAQV